MSNFIRFHYWRNFILIVFKFLVKTQKQIFLQIQKSKTSVLSTAGGAEDHRWTGIPAVAMVSGILGTICCMVIGGKTIREGMRLCCFFLCAFEDHIDFLYLGWHLGVKKIGMVLLMEKYDRKYVMVMQSNESPSCLFTSFFMFLHWLGSLLCSFTRWKLVLHS